MIHIYFKFLPFLIEMANDDIFRGLVCMSTMVLLWVMAYCAIGMYRE